MAKRSTWARGTLVSIGVYTYEQQARTYAQGVNNRSNEMAAKVFPRAVRAGRAEVIVWAVVVRKLATPVTDEDRAVTAEEDRIEAGQARWSETGSTKPNR